MKNNIVKNKIKSASDFVFTFLKWSVAAAVIGIVGGLVGTIFHESVSGANNIFAKHDWIVLMLPVGGLVIVALYHAAKLLDNKGTDNVISSIQNGEKVPFLLAPLIFVSTVITHLLGGSAGREGAALQLGGSIGSGVGKILKLDDIDKRMLVMCGMSAVFSALFGTPVTAAVFSLGVASVGLMYYSCLVPCLISALSAFLVTLGFGVKPTHFALAYVPSVTLISVLQTILIGALCAALSIVFCLAMHYTAKGLKNFLKNPYLRIFTGGLIIIALTYAVSALTGTHDYNGSGMNIIVNAVEGGKTVGYAWILKLLFTAITIGAGYKGGEIVPTFFVGATFGCFAGNLFGLDPGFAAALGMVAMFCGVLNCPVASIILSVELFGAEGFALFAIAAAVSYMLSGYYGLYGSQKIIYSKLRAELADDKYRT